MGLQLFARQMSMSPSLDETEEEDLSPEEHIRRLRVAIKQARDERWMAETKAHLYRDKLQSLHKSLGHAREDVLTHRFSLSKIRTDALQLRSLVQTETRLFASAVLGAVQEHGEVKAGEGKKITELRQQVQRLKEDLKDHDSAMQKVEEELRHKTKEANQLGIKVRSVDVLAEQKVAKKERLFIEKEEEVKSMRREWNILLRKHEKRETELQESARKLSKVQHEAELMKTLLGKANTELDSVNTARTHLKDKFVKLEERNKSLQEQAQEAQDENERLASELHCKASFWKEKYKQDLANERENFKVELTSNAMNYRNDLTQIKQQLESQQRRLKDRVTSLQRQLHEAKDAAASRERELRAEIERLRKQLSSRPTEQDIPQALQSMESTQELERYKEKVQHLETLIQRECNERKKLLRAFHETKKELLALKKPPGGYQGEQQTQNSARNGEALSLFRRRNNSRKAEIAPVGFVDFQNVPMKNILKVKQDNVPERESLPKLLSKSQQIEQFDQKRQEHPTIEKEEQSSDKSLKTFVKGSKLSKPLPLEAEKPHLKKTQPVNALQSTSVGEVSSFGWRRS